jgi:hypothetical protein
VIEDKKMRITVNKNGVSDPSPESAVVISKRVILSMGGKGSVGKSSIIVGFAEWFEINQIPVKLLDLDTENEAAGIDDSLFRLPRPVWMILATISPKAPLWFWRI